MLIFTDFQEIDSRCEGWHRTTHVIHSVTCCSKESIKVLGLQSKAGSGQHLTYA